MWPRCLLSISFALIACAGGAACSGPGTRSDVPAALSIACDDAAIELADAAALREQGFLGRARGHIERAFELCDSGETRAARAEILAELWIDGGRVNARDASAEDREQARSLYRAGHLVRVEGRDYALALRRLEESYELAPHPATLVEMALAHRDAGREVDYRVYNARALAIAAHLQDAEPEPVVQRGHVGEVHAVAVHPTRFIAATAGDDGAVIVWDLTTGRALNVLRHDHPVLGVQFSGDGNVLVSGDAGSTIHVWDPLFGDALATLRRGAGRVNALALSPDGSLVASTSEDGVVVLDLATGAKATTLAGHAGNVLAIAFAPDNAMLATAGVDGTVTLWDVATWTERPAPFVHGRPVTSVAFGPDGTTLASGGDDGVVRLWDVAAGTQRAKLTGHGDAVVAVAFSPDGTHIAGAAGSRVRLWDVAGGVQIGVLTGHELTVTSVAFSPDGARVVSAGAGSTVRVWDVGTGVDLRLIPRAGEVSSLAYSPDGAHLAAADSRSAKLWSVRAPLGVAKLSDEDNLLSVAFDPLGARVAWGGERGAITLWDVASRSPLVTFPAHTDWVQHLCFRPDGAVLASAGPPDPARLWDAATGTAIETLGAAGISAIRFHPDGAQIATGHETHGIQVWEGQPPAVAAVVSRDAGTLEDVVFSPDGAMIASFNTDNELVLWRADSGAPMRAVSRHEWIYDIGFSPAGDVLAAATQSDGVRLYRVTGGDEPRVLRDRAGSIHALAFSPDGAHLASGGADGVIQVWDVALERPVATLFSTESGAWVATRAGEPWVDGAPGPDGGESLVYWQIGGIQLPGYVGWQRYHAPERFDASLPAR